MGLNPLYFVTSDLEGYFVDKDSGLPLAGGTLSFYRDVARNTPKTVYELTGAPPDYDYVALPNPVVLSSVGTPMDNGGDNVVIYYYPYDIDGNLDLYYVVCEDSNGVVQFTREAWPNLTESGTPTQNDFEVANQISNSQFSQVFINQNQSTVYTVSAATNQDFEFAPNWDFVISGTGTVTVQQIALDGNEQIVTSPPYAIDVSLSSGITACYLRQRFNANSGLWASTATQSIFLSGTFVAINESAGTTGLQMFYTESTGGTPISIVDASFDNSGYQVLTGVTADPIPLSTNTDMGFVGYIDIYLSFLPSSHIRLSSIQVVPTLNPSGGALVPYELNSSNREQALMGDYYIPRLNTRPVPSILTAWDFPLNPFQFNASGNLTTTAAYICDQTIGVAGASGNVAFARDSVTNGLAFTTAGTNDSFYILQYLSGAQAKKLLGTRLSVNVFGYMTSNSSNVTMQVYLCRAPSTSTIPTLATTIGTVNTSGVLTLTASGWTIIPRSGLPTPSAVLPYVSADSLIPNSTNDMGFTGWEITDNTQISDTQYFAIVVTFAYISTSTTLTMNSISVTPSDIPTRPAPQTFDEVVRECQYYYEKSYDLGIYAGAANTNGSLVCEQGRAANTGSSGGGCANYIPVRYNTRKRAAITPTLYSPNSGTSGNTYFLFYRGSTLLYNSDVALSGNWTVGNSGHTGITFIPVNRSAVLIGFNIGTGPYDATIECVTNFHYVADARLGIV